MANSQAVVQYGKVIGDFTPKPMIKRDENSPVIDMNFNLLNQVVRSNSDRLASLSTSITNINSAIGSLTVPLSANPSASVGLSAVNGSASTYMRSDAAPAISQAITPTWSALHTFTLAPKVSAFAGGGSQMVVTDNVGQLGVQAIPSSTLANPSATIGLSAVNGSASSAMRSDGAPALSQAIVPTWTGAHTFSTGIYPSYISNGQVTYLDKSKNSALVPFQSGDWTTQNVTVSSGDISTTGGVGSSFARRSNSGFNAGGKWMYWKAKYTEHNASGSVFHMGFSTDSLHSSSRWGFLVSSTNHFFTLYHNGSSISGTTATASTDYYVRLWINIYSSTSTLIYYVVTDSTDSTLIDSKSFLSTQTVPSTTVYYGIWGDGSVPTYHLYDFKNAGIDSDTGGGKLTGNSLFVFDEFSNSLGIGQTRPQYTVDVSGTLRVTGAVNLPGQTASRAMFTDASSNVTTNAITGTGNVVMSASPTLTGTITAAGATFSSTVTLSASRLLMAKGADVASANDITLGNGNHFQITGTTQINRILTTTWQAGSVIFLKFSGSLTVKHQGAVNGSSFARLNLSGSVDFAATANDTLTLIYDGTDWFELARTVI